MYMYPFISPFLKFFVVFIRLFEVFLVQIFNGRFMSYSSEDKAIFINTFEYRFWSTSVLKRLILHWLFRLNYTGM